MIFQIKDVQSYKTICCDSKSMYVLSDVPTLQNCVHFFCVKKDRYLQNIFKNTLTF